MSLLERVVVPVATDEDAAETAMALEPHIDDIESISVVHVIEKSGGGIDKAPMEKREQDAKEMFDAVERRLGDRVSVASELAYGTDVVEALFETAEDLDATSVAFVAREGGRFVRLLSGDTSMRLVTEGTIPVIALPRNE